MRYRKFKNRNLLFILIVMVFCSLSWGIADAGVYLDSAHGDATDGVNRSALGYPIGFCDHCHEQHASIGGSEPAPTTGTSPSKFALFYYPTIPSQTDNFCFQCHTDASGYQNGGSITNLTYSYRAGRWVDSVDDILEVFSYTSSGTSHNLGDISSLIDNNWKGWGYSDSSNPCNACHNPHAAQGDPQGNGGGTTSAKTSTLSNRGWPVSLPSLHNTNNNTWGLWGDNSPTATERMSDYASSVGGTYQAPYKYNASAGAPAYEPDGSGTTNGSNLTDYATFCIDCHNASNTIYSTTLGRNLKTFAWATEKHGGTGATDDGLFAGVTIDDLIDPYDETTVTNYVLSCTDCHEPHGSANSFLIREGVNGGTSTTTVNILSTPDNTKQWKNLCSKCHDTSLTNNKTIHHRAYKQEFGGSYMSCGYCHEPDSDDYRNCLLCHYHGSTQWPAVPADGLSTYDYTEKMF